MYAAQSKLDMVAGGPVSISDTFPFGNTVEQAIVNTVAYADVFDYPISIDEMHRYLIAESSSADALSAELDRVLRRSSRLESKDGFTFLRGRGSTLALRHQRQARSDALWVEAARYGRLIAQLPFVRMVAVTGSLAVNNVGSYEDIDYFVVTADDFLWITRAMTIAIVRLAARRGVRLCPNYFLSERALAISDQTLYTAHEIAQMVPLAGRNVYETFRAANRWTDAFLPNATEPPALPAVFTAEDAHERSSSLTRPIEWLLRAPPGQRLTAWEMKRKIRKLSEAHSGALETNYTADCCKGHFDSHQNRTMQAYQARLEASSQQDSL